MLNLMGKVKTLLYKFENLRKSKVLQVFDYSQSESVEGGALGCS